MTTRSVGLGEMFGWIPAGIRMVRGGKGPLMAAALWMVAVLLVVIGPLLTVMAFDGAFAMHGPGQPYRPSVLFWVAEAVVLVFSLFAYPALAVGWYRLCSALDDGQAPRGSIIFAAFHEPALWGRAMKVVLVAVAIGALLFAVMLLPFASTFMAFQHASQARQAALASGGELPPLDFPALMFFMYFAWIFLVVIVQMIAGLAFGEVSARPAGALEAMRLAAEALGRNFFKLLLFWFCLSSLVGAVVMVVLIPIIVIGVLLAFIHPLLLAVVVGLGYAGMLLVIYPAMFVFRYLMWKGLLGGSTPPPVPTRVSA